MLIRKLKYKEYNLSNFFEEDDSQGKKWKECVSGIYFQNILFVSKIFIRYSKNGFQNSK